MSVNIRRCLQAITNYLLNVDKRICVNPCVYTKLLLAVTIATKATSSIDEGTRWLDLSENVQIKHRWVNRLSLFCTYICTKPNLEFFFFRTHTLLMSVMCVTITHRTRITSTIRATHSRSVATTTSWGKKHFYTFAETAHAAHVEVVYV